MRELSPRKRRPGRPPAPWTRCPPTTASEAVDVEGGCQRPRTMIGPGPCAWCPRQDSSRDTRFEEFDPRMPLMPSPAGPALVRGCCCVPPSGLVDVSVGCQRNRSGAGQISNGSSGRSAHRHQVCRPAHRHRERQTLRPSSSRLDRTRPPDAQLTGHGSMSRGRCGPPSGGGNLSARRSTRFWVYQQRLRVLLVKEGVPPSDGAVRKLLSGAGALLRRFGQCRRQ